MKLFRPSMAVALAALLVACSSPSRRAPVEDRSAPPPRPLPAALTVPAGVAGSVETAAAKPLPGAENAGKPGYYTVRPGDTLIRVALDNGQPWRDVQRWNGLDNPNLIEVGQVLRVVPPGVDAGSAAARAVAPAARVETRPLDAAARPPAAAASAAVAAAAAASAPAPAPAPVPAPRDAEEELNWMWPAAGTVVAGFDDSKNKGLDIVGKAGDPVLAAADGRVVYAGAGLRGLGNLVIVKHNATYLTAYAHNQALLVKEDQPVRRGQKIAEMGSSDADRVQLHFEIRRQGKPVDPARLLPAR